jgi:nicotinamidase-related amidase
MVPDSCRVALVLLDVINDLEFPGGARLLAHALPMARRLAALRARAHRAGVPVIYVNDNYGRWQSDFRRLTAHCLEDGVRGRPLAELLAPAPDDYFVLKPKHSGFYATSLELLLSYLGSETLIVTGLAGDRCVLFTVSDAYMRDYRLVVPADCVASETARANHEALAQMRRLFRVSTTPSARLRLAALRRPRRPARPA